MRFIEQVCQYLGAPYSVSAIDTEEVIYRKLNDDFEIEVSGVHAKKQTYSIYVWQIRPHRELVGIYHNICGREALKDALGYCSVKYRNLLREIQVEREEM